MNAREPKISTPHLAKGIAIMNIECRKWPVGFYFLQTDCKWFFVAINDAILDHGQPVISLQHKIANKCLIVLIFNTLFMFLFLVSHLV